MDVTQNTVQLLILMIGDSRYGIDIDQIAYLAKVDTDQTAVSFAELMAADSFLACNYSKMLIVKQTRGLSVLICEPDEVMTCLVSDIRTLPDILMVSAKNRGVWGVLPQKRGVIILVDLYKNQLFKGLSNPIDHQI